FDANVSIRPEGAEGLGTKVEVKNMNSFRSLERAVEYEIERQISFVEAGGELTQETRHWDEEAGVTQSMRIKEGSSDYRYFVEPDLAPMVMSASWVDEVRVGLPELPAERKARYSSEGLEPDLAGVLSSSPVEVRDIFEVATAAGADHRRAANWLTGEVTAWLRRTETDPTKLSLGGEQLAELVEIVDDGVVSSSAAKVVLEGVLQGEGSPREVAKARDLVQISDMSAIEEIVTKVLADNPEAVDSYAAGEEKVVGFLVGQVMRVSRGKADPKLVSELLRKKLSS
ncbi:MAG: Asp-tRNA(Asn)/Glu-tRNA(Gln) amidotransferase GatCAB subunit B, partial [Actinobacteria bacterium]|nr:Asp-tRNA(Asn)/Glu-tRNA(Gln) amidotransferase GatCAB subunit B [Actinomycetota bacterium]